MNPVSIDSEEKARSLREGPKVLISITYSTPSKGGRSNKQTGHSPESNIKFLAFPLNLLLNLSPAIARQINSSKNVNPDGLALFHVYPDALTGLLDLLLRYITMHPFTPVRSTLFFPNIDLGQNAFYKYGCMLEAARYLENPHIIEMLRFKMTKVAYYGQVRIKDVEAIYKDEYCYKGNAGEWMRGICAWSIVTAIEYRSIRAGRLYKWYTDEEEGKEFRMDLVELLKREIVEEDWEQRVEIADTGNAEPKQR